MKNSIIGAAVAFALIATFVEAGAMPPWIISYWRFDDAAGAVALDSAGANHGALVSGPVWVEGRVAGALSFDGFDDYVQAPDSASLDIAGPEITIEAWIYPNSVSHENIILKKGSSKDCDNYNLFIKDSHLALLSSDSCSWGNAGPNAIVASGSWQHIAATFDGTFLRYYVNGDLKDTIAMDGLGSLNDDVLTIGGPVIAGWGDSRYFNGMIDEVVLYSRRLTSAEIRQHYLNGFPYGSRR